MPGRTVISFTLTTHSIERAISELRRYRDELPGRIERLRRMIAERIAWSASAGFRVALHADVVYGNPEPNDVYVTVEHQDTVSIVIANGEEAVFIEYGAGVTNNGNVGGSPHPWGAEKGYTIGGYGKGRGAGPVWGYYRGGIKSRENLVVTRGTPAAMPMFRGWQEAQRALDEMVQEVFG